MGITAVLAVLSSIGGAIVSFAAKLPWWLWVALAIFLAGGWVFHGGSCRDFACRRTPKPRPPIMRTIEGTVTAVHSASEFVLSVGKRSHVCQIAYVVTPRPDESQFAAAKALTEKLLPVGSTATITVEGRRRILGASESEDRLEAPEDTLEWRPGVILTGRVKASNGADIATELIKAGFAHCGPDAPSDLITVEKAAKHKR